MSGSVFAWPADRRPQAARDLRLAGFGVHVDLIDRTFPVGEGVSPARVAELAAAGGGRTDLHLMGRFEPVDEALPLERVTVHLRAGEGLRAVNDGWWVSIDPAEWSADRLDRVLDRLPGAGGVVVMLAPPGTRGVAPDPDLVGGAVWRVARRLPVGVDGGVDLALARRAVSAGASWVVAGRALRAALGDGRD